MSTTFSECDSGLGGLQFLVVSNDYNTLRSFTAAAEELGGQIDSTPSLTTANRFVQRYRLDGIVIDMQMQGALDFIETVREGNSNRSSVIFACAGVPLEENSAIRAGANFVFHKPFSVEKILTLLSATAPSLEEEHRNYFRHQLVIPVTIDYDGVQHRALTANLSESGMAIRSFRLFQAGAPVGFSFQLPSGPVVKGRGEIVWTDAGGSAGIKFLSVSGCGQSDFTGWLDRNEVLQR
ncbi:MAG TPA: PilZ domain-containing protein [Candidatus Angelobacter sp.]|jgi:CheY-like chemotaxis protein|nr:PilZ domain-containing protein [Candidatus Angelobacter sp.]